MGRHIIPPRRRQPASGVVCHRPYAEAPRDPAIAGAIGRR